MIPIFQEEFKKNFYFYIILRFFFIIIIFVNFIVFPLLREEPNLYSIKNKIFIFIFFAYFIFNILSLLWIKKVKFTWLINSAYFEFFIELLFLVSISFLSGGINSPYLYVIIITIVYSGILLQEKGAIFSTFIALSLIILEIIFIKNSILPLISSNLVDLYIADNFYIFSKIFMFLLFFILSGIIASRVSKNVLEMNKTAIESKRTYREVRQHFFSIFSSLDMGLVLVKGDSFSYLNENSAKLGQDLKIIIQKMLKEIEFYRKWQEIFIKNRYYSFTIIPYFENQKFIIFSDITEAKLKEEEQQKQQKMIAIGQLTASIAHEIKNPLASLIGASEMIFLEEMEKEEKEELITIIKREGTRVKKLLDDLFNYTEEPKRITLNTIEITSILKDVLKLFNAYYKEIKFDIKGLNQEIKIVGDTDKIKEIFWNIIINGIEVMNETGVFHIELQKNEKKVKLIFEDEGGGIKNDLDKVFDPFFSTKKRGTGLGLALVYKVVKMHGGEIFVENGELGAKFTITFPTVKEG